jgi:hypothetical protein
VLPARIEAERVRAIAMDFPMFSFGGGGEEGVADPVGQPIKTTRTITLTNYQ